MDTLVERYQLIYQKDPESKVFAPLAEAYRKMGMINEAIELAEKGVKKHPHFASGRVALGKSLLQKGDYIKAEEHLRMACDLSPENILAHQTLGECYLKLKQKQNALQSFKMVLFLNAQDKKAAEVVQKLEKEVFFAQEGAEEFADENFAMQKLKALENEEQVKAPVANIISTDKNQKFDLDRELALLDSRINRGQWAQAKEQVNQLFTLYPLEPKVIERKEKIKQVESGDMFLNKEWISPIEVKIAKQDKNQSELQVAKLKKLLSTIQARRNS